MSIWSLSTYYSRNWKIVMTFSYVLQTDFKWSTELEIEADTDIGTKVERSTPTSLLFSSSALYCDVSAQLICILLIECTSAWVQSATHRNSRSMHIRTWKFRFGFTAILGGVTPWRRGEWSTDLQHHFVVFVVARGSEVSCVDNIVFVSEMISCCST